MIAVDKYRRAASFIALRRLLLPRVLIFVDVHVCTIYGRDRSPDFLKAAKNDKNCVTVKFVELLFYKKVNCLQNSSKQRVFRSSSGREQGLLHRSCYFHIEME